MKIRILPIIVFAAILLQSCSPDIPFDTSDLTSYNEPHTADSTGEVRTYPSTDVPTETLIFQTDSVSTAYITEYSETDFPATTGKIEAPETKATVTSTETAAETTAETVPITTAKPDPVTDAETASITTVEETKEVLVDFTSLPALDKVMFAIEQLYSADSGKAVLNGETVAAGLMTQITRTEKSFTRTGNTVKSNLSTVSNSSVVNIDDRAYGDGTTYNYSSDGGKTYSKYSKADYIKNFGPVPEQLIPYTVSAKTIIEGSVKETKSKLGEIQITLDLIPSSGAAEYINQIKSNAERGGAKYNDFKYIKLTFVISKTGVIRTMSVDEQYSMKYLFMTVNCTSVFNYEFNASINAD